MRQVGFLLVIVLLASCGEETNADHPSERNYNDPSFLLFMDSTEHIMGVSLGDTVRKYATNDGAIVDGDLVEWTSPFIVPDTTDRRIRCRYGDAGLYDIQIDITAESDWRAALYFQDIRKHYNAVFGTDKADDTYITWTFPWDNNTVEVSLVDQSPDHAGGRVSISYFVRWGH